MLSVLICAGCSHASPLSVNGQVVLESGQPVDGGIVVIAELHGRPFSMPSVAESLEVKTDGTGKFVAEFNYQGGDLNISLDAMPCKWSTAFVRFDAVSLKGLRTLSPKLITKPLQGAACDPD